MDRRQVWLSLTIGVAIYALFSDDFGFIDAAGASYWSGFGFLMHWMTNQENKNPLDNKA